MGPDLALQYCKPATFTGEHPKVGVVCENLLK